MNFEVLSVNSADPGYGQYNVGPTSGAQYYDGKAFVDSHDDGTTYCGQAQSMPAVVSLKLDSNTARTVATPVPQISNNPTRSPDTIELGTVIMQENTPFVVTSFVETPLAPAYGSKNVFVPIAVTGTTMVESKYVIGGDTAIKAGQLLEVEYNSGQRPLGIAMMDEESSVGTSRLIMVYVSA